MDSDIIIIGGGPSGLMAAVAAGQNGASVLLIDKGDKLGRKLAISGGGRCNVTNAMETDQLIRHIPGNGRFLYSAFAEFGNRDIIAFFEGLGIPLKEEDRGRMFPVSDKAKTVVDALVKEVRRLGVRIRTNRPVKELLIRDGKAEGVLLHGGETLRSRAVIVATGGKSVPHTGSTGDAYPWAIAAGHTVTDLYPTEVPLTSSETFIRSRTLQGLSLRDIELTVWNPKGKKIITHDGDLLFTHFGLSGPTALRCSQFVVKTLKKFDVRTVLLTIDLLPDRTENAVTDEARSRAAGEPKKHIRNTLKGMLPERLIPVVLDKAGIAEDALFDHISKSSWARLAEVIKRFPVEIDGTLSIEEAFVTGGGVSLKEIDPRTMASRIVQGLYFCGEVLDIHGYTGGYNITAAFVTGHAAGRSAARQTREEREKREAPADDSV